MCTHSHDSHGISSATLMNSIMLAGMAKLHDEHCQSKQLAAQPLSGKSPFPAEFFLKRLASQKSQ
jgi:hypothetical protein